MTLTQGVKPVQNFLTRDIARDISVQQVKILITTWDRSIVIDSLPNVEFPEVVSIWTYLFRALHILQKFTVFVTPRVYVPVPQLGMHIQL